MRSASGGLRRPEAAEIRFERLGEEEMAELGRVRADDIAAERVAADLLHAPVMPPGLRVNCTAEASARNSR